jgi:hypothetical protein
MKKKYVQINGVEISQSALDVAALLMAEDKSITYSGKDGDYHMKAAVFPANIVVSVTGPDSRNSDCITTEIINVKGAYCKNLSSLITEFRKRNNTGFSDRY